MTRFREDGVPLLEVPVAQRADRECVAAVLGYLLEKAREAGRPPVTVEEAVLFAVRCTADTIRGGEAP